MALKNETTESIEKEEIKMPVVLLFLKKEVEQDHEVARGWFDGKKSNLLKLSKCSNSNYEFVHQIKDVMQSLNRVQLSKNIILIEAVNEEERANGTLIANLTAKFDYAIWIDQIADLNIFKKIDEALEEFYEAQLNINEGKRRLWNSYALLRVELMEKGYPPQKIIKEVEKIERAQKSNDSYLSQIKGLVSGFIL